MEALRLTNRRSWQSDRRFRHVRELQMLSMLVLATVFVFMSNADLRAGADLRARELLTGKASTVAALLKPSEIKHMLTDHVDGDCACVAQVREILVRVKQSDPWCRFVYLMAKRGDEVIFLCDAEDPASPDFSHYGQVYPDATAELLEAFNGPHALTEGPVDDEWGTWISALAPIVDPTTGSVLAIIGIDYDARQWYASLGTSGNIAALPYLAICAALLFSVSTARLYQRLEHTAAHDQLTGVFNRQELADRVADWAARARHKGALLLVNIDDFRGINDGHSPSEGDRVLRAVAKILVEVAGKGAMVGRQGGDEFAVVLPYRDPVGAEEMAAAIRSRIADVCIVGSDYPVSVSIGIAPLAPEVAFVDCIALATDALAAAKAQGKSLIRHGQATSAIAGHSIHRSVRSVLSGLRDDRFEFWLQPIRRTTGAQEVVFHEALLRLREPGGEILRPAEFLPAARNYGLMPRLDLRSVRRALGMLSCTEPHFRLSVNLAGATLADERALASIAQMVKQARLDQGRLIFEVTESTPLADLPATRQWLNSMRDLGAEIAIDDFGSGYCSYEYLRELRVQYAKIDGKWIRAALTDPSARVLIGSVVEYASTCGASVVAEAIETAEEFAMVVAERVPFGQGYLLGRPVPALEIVGAEVLAASLA